MGNRAFLLRCIPWRGSLIKAIPRRREFLLKSSMDPGLFFQVLVTGFAYDTPGVQGWAVVSYHWSGKPAMRQTTDFVNENLSRSCMQVLIDIWCCMHFYEILENAFKILHALQNDCSMKVSRKLFNGLRKKYMNFLYNIAIIFFGLQVFVCTFNKQFFSEK